MSITERRYGRFFEAAHVTVDGLVRRSHRVHRMPARGRALRRRNVEHVERRIVDVVVEQILHPPADRSAQLVARYVRRVDQEQLILAGLEQRFARAARETELARGARERVGRGERARAELEELRTLRAAARRPVREIEASLCDRDRHPTRRLGLLLEPTQGDAPLRRNIRLELI
ncbi:MAG: hypothetical protein M5U08_09305 [Burkholderiales bacterium]|nr:hypothetical protein [Burkholderiales bacterium]